MNTQPRDARTQQFAPKHNSAPDVELSDTERMQKASDALARGGVTEATQLLGLPPMGNEYRARTVQMVQRYRHPIAYAKSDALVEAAEMLNACQCTQTDDAGNQVQAQSCPHHGDPTAQYVGQAVVTQLRRLAELHIRDLPQQLRPDNEPF